MKKPGCPNQWASQFAILVFTICSLCCLVLAKPLHSAKTAVALSLLTAKRFAQSTPLVANATTNKNQQQQIAIERGRTKATTSEFMMHCASLKSPRISPVVHTISSFKIFVYPTNDIVSKRIQQLNSWESHELEQILWAMQAVPRGSRKGHAQPSGQTPHFPKASAHGPRISPALFVDVGANVGYFTLAVAARRYSVIAFEAMPDNQDLLAHTLCMNPVLSNRVTLHKFGLGEKQETCFMFASFSDQGNGNMLCGMKTRYEAMEHLKNVSITSGPRDYVLRGEAQIQRLDDVVFSDIKVLKIDVEGYEPMVLRGATNLFAKHKVWFIVLAYNLPALQHALRGTKERPSDFVWELRARGYKISTQGFRGPWMHNDEVQQLEKEDIVNLYFAHREFFQRHAAVAAAP